MKKRERIWAIFEKNYDEEDMQSTLEKTIQEVGMNSLNFIKFIVSIEDEFDIEVADELLDVTQYECIKDIFDAIEGMICD